MRFITNKKKDQIIEHLNRISKPTDKNNIFPPAMNTETAFNELCDYFLGEDWYTACPMSPEQVNWEMVYQIETKFKGK